MRKPIIFLVGVFLLILGFYVGRLFTFDGFDHGIRKKTPLQLKIEELYYLIDEKYIDSIDVDSVFISTISDMISKLDPHSGYLTNQEKQEENKLIEGAYLGLGMDYFWPYKDSLIVLKIDKDSPADRAKLRLGDRIVSVKKRPVENWNESTDSLLNYLSGKEGDVQFTYYRPDEKKLYDAVLKPGAIPYSSIKASYLINDSTGYIAIRHFSKLTDIEFNDAVIKLSKRPIKTMILDLRGNPGGLFFKAHEVADQFLKDGELITYTENKKGQIEKFYASRNGLLEKSNVYILMDEHTASAAEVLAGSIQDNDRGVLIGRNSYGKGMVQEEIELDDGTTLKLTIAQYYTPSGRSIQRPYKDKSNEDYQKMHTIKTKKQVEKEIDSAKSKVYYTKKGRKVHGGGGITPDVWIEYETNNPQKWIKLNSNDLKAEYVAEEYYRKNRNTLLEEYPNLDSFLDNFLDESELYDNFVDYFGGKDKMLNNPKYQETLVQYMRASLASYLYGEDAFYKVWQMDDEMINKALDMELQ